MPVVKIMLDPESFKTLSAVAFEERRPVLWQAEVLLLQALGRWPVPQPVTASKIEEAAHVG